MDPVAIAAYMVQSQALVTRGDLGVALIKQQQSISDQVVGLIADSAAAPSAPSGTGMLLNVSA